MRVQDVMTKGVKTIAPTAAADDAWNVMRLNRIQHLVVTKANRVVGVPSDRDAGAARGAAVRENSTVHRRIFIKRAYAVLARLPRPLLIGFAASGHRIMEARHLRGIQRRCATPSAGHKARHEPWRKLPLFCGIASSLLYALMIWAIRYEGYDPISQVPSELTAIGAPTQALWARLGWIYTVLATAFGLGLWKSARGNRPLRIVGGLILAYASLGLLWPFAAMHQREVLAAGGATWSDTAHVVLGGVTVFLMFLAIGFGAAAFGKRFRLYSIATIVVLLVFGGLTFLEAPRLQANLPTPWIGLWERINISVFLLWVVMLGAVLWRTGTPAKERRDKSRSSPFKYRGEDLPPSAWTGFELVSSIVGRRAKTELTQRVDHRGGTMVRRSLVVWLVMLGVASVNGALRETLLIPTTGVPAGRAISTLILSALVLLLPCHP